jgi:hypothetical protein
VGPWAGVNDVQKRNMLPLLGLELRPLSLSASSQSLYRPSCPGVSVQNDLQEVEKDILFVKYRNTQLSQNK